MMRVGTEVDSDFSNFPKLGPQIYSQEKIAHPFESDKEDTFFSQPDMLFFLRIEFESPRFQNI